MNGKPVVWLIYIAAGAGTRAWQPTLAAGATSTPASPTSAQRSSVELENTTYTDLLVPGRGAAAVQAVQLQHEPPVPGGEEGDGPQHPPEGAPLRRAQQVSQLPLVLTSSIYFYLFRWTSRWSWIAIKIFLRIWTEFRKYRKPWTKYIIVCTKEQKNSTHVSCPHASSRVWHLISTWYI